MKKKLLFSLILLLFSNDIFALENSIKSNVLNIYSSRKEEFLIDLLDVFSKKYNVTINTINDHDAQKLLEKIKSAKSSNVYNSEIDPDILITADVISIIEAKKNNLLQNTNCEIYKDIKSFFLDGDCFWSAISFRARVIAYSKIRVSDMLELRNLQNYFDLAQKKWFERVIFTPISSPYNQFLIAYLITLHGENIVDKWLYDLIEYNKYSNPNGSDTEKLKSIMSNRGDIAMINSYYYFRMLLNDGVKDSDFDSKIGIIFPNQNYKGIDIEYKMEKNKSTHRIGDEQEHYKEEGTSINISAIGIIKDAPHFDIAEKFVQFLLSPEAQEMIVRKNYEYSVTLQDLNDMLNQNVQSSEVKFDMKTRLIDVSRNVKTAIKLAVKNGWN
jgi:iron(III) transport system substrate-binding protein